MSTKTCPVCNTSKHTSAFSAVKHICNLCHLDGKTYTPPEKARKPTEAEILQAELAARTLARRRLIHFVQRFKPDYQAGWVHHDICRRLERFMHDVEAKKSPRLLLCMPPRAGKALALDTPVPTPTGWTTMGDLKVGDTVFSDTGNPCKVVSKSPVWVNREAYVVKTDMGDSIVADAEHEWVVRLCRKRPVFKTKTTKYLAERTSNRAPLLAAAGSLNLPERDLPIHPYVLGVWLGGGRTSSAAMCSADPEIVEHVSLIEGGHTEYENRNGTLHFRVGPHYRNGATKAETLQGRLRTLGLLGNKHIPIMYLRASREQRLELLQGLIDTDGHVADNGLVEFCNTNKLLAEGVRELVNSLGVKASLNTGRAMCDGKDCGLKYRVLFMLENAAKLTRKRVKTRNGVRQPGTYLTFEPAGRVDTVCIEVDSPSHQFLCGRTMIPTHNSELTSRNFPAWVLGHHPEWEIIAASHTQSLALSFSRHLRDKIRDPAYEAVFPDCVLDPQSQSVENWMTTAGGGYMAAGVGTGITGRGATIFIVDDPVKDMEAADSQLIRDNTWEWWTSTAYTRLAPGGGVLGIMTLWNDDDWGGRTITYSENGEGDKFEIVRYPAINEGYDEYQENETYSIVKKYPADPVPVNATLIRKADSALHPDRYDAEMLLKIKRNLYASGQQRVWSALYQQNPAPEEGAYFTKDLFRYYSTPPRRRGNFVYQAWDFAIAEGQENDYTVGATILQDERDALHVLDVKRFKSADSIYIVDVILDYAAEFDADLLGFEDGQIWKTMQAQFDKRCDERRMYPTYEILKPLTDKKARANPLKGRMQAGKVYFPDKAPWLHDVYTELLRFPAGKHDDCHSAATLVDSPNGPQRIIDLRDGDEILTYDGQSVLVGVVGNHHCTGVKMVLEVTLEDGTRLELTAGHPVLTARGYVYAGDLLDSDEIVRKEVCTFYATVSSGHRSQTGTGSRQPLSTEKDNGCTDTLGSKSATQSLLGATSTTLTETAQTTTSRTFSALHGLSTPLSTAMSVLRRVTRLGRGKILKESGNSPLKQKQASTLVRKSRDDLSTAFGRVQLAEQSSSWVRRTTTRLLTVLRLVSKRLAESTPSGSTTGPCHASTVGERSYLGGTESVIASSALSHAVTNTDTQTSTSVESVKGAARPCTSRLGALRATAEIAKLLGRTCEKPNARPAGQRFYPETKMAAYSAIENVLTSCEDLSVTRLSMSDSNRLFVKVVSIREIGFQETYNFDVVGTRNFLVENGIVVHNCVDALAWAVRLTLTRSAPKLPEPAKIKSWKDKLLTGGSLEGTSHMAA